MLYFIGSLAGLCVLGAGILFLLPSDEQSGPKRNEKNPPLSGIQQNTNEFGYSNTQHFREDFPAPLPESKPIQRINAFAMTPIEILFSFEGRIGRGHWWIYHIISAVAITVLVLIAILSPMPLLFPFIIILAIWTFIAIDIKRWHDRDKFGFWIFILLIPVIGKLWVLIELGFLPGTEGENRFGPRFI